MSFVIDSNAPYFTEFPLKNTGDAVYMTAEDDALGHVFAIVYRAHRGVPKLSVILFGTHGTSGYVDMTLDRTSRYFGACRGLAPSHYKSSVRRALAIAVLRTYATVDKPLRQKFRGQCDEAAAGALGSRFRLVYGKFPGTIGRRVLEAGLISPKRISSSIVDIVYEDSDSTIDQNNELVYLLGEQLEQLFDPLSEYSPEPTEKLYVPPESHSDGKQLESQNGSKTSVGSLDNEPRNVQDICEELYLQQAHARGDILDLLQTTLIPLRVEVLKGRFASLSIARLNSVFPPTIDELFRINNLLYEALRAALPFGAFEVVRACGATIPYFFRACMRHEAATRNFAQLLADLLSDEPEVAQFLLTDSAKLEKVIRNTSHLQSLKNVLDRLVHAKQWGSAAVKKQVDEFFSAAVSTVDAFNRKDDAQQQPSVSNVPGGYGRKLASASRFVREVMKDWPTELEDGWDHRRVVTVFDTLDVLEPRDSARELHTVFIMFTDSLVLCQPTEPVPSESSSNVHMPSVGDLLMHAMINEAPLDRKLPPLKVVAWAPILDVQFASYDKQHLYVFSPGIVGSYKLTEPENNTDDLVTLLAKAKITTKTQPFHLFKIEGPETTIYSTVQELEGYKQEVNRTNVALFLSTNISERTLHEYRLAGAVSLHLDEDGETVAVKVVSRMRYVAEFEIKKSELQDLIVNELAYLLTLSLSSQNQAMLDLIVASNRLAVTRLIKWASQPEAQHNNSNKSGHGRIGTTASGAKSELESPTKAGRAQAPSRALAGNNAAVQDHTGEAAVGDRRLFVVPDESLESITPVNRSLRKIVGHIPPNSRDLSRNADEEERTDIDKDPSLKSEQFYSSYSISSVAGDNSASLSTDGSNRFESFSSNEALSEEAEQRDVDNWYHQLHTWHHDDQSLSSDLSDVDMNTPSQHSVSNSSSIQIGGFFDKSTSNLYNKNAGRAFPRIEDVGSVSSSLSKEQHRRQDTEDSFETITSIQDSIMTSDASMMSPDTTVENEDEDFSYLAALVDTTSLNAKTNEPDRGGVYPDLRESSLVRLGSYILRTDKSQREFPNASLSAIPENQVKLPPSLVPSDKEDKLDLESDLDMKTPTLSSGKFSAAPVSPEAAGDEGSYTPFANVEMANWHPKPVKSGTTATLSGLLPRTNRKGVPSKRASVSISRDPSMRNLSSNAEDEFDEDASENAKRWLAWAESSGRPTSMLSLRTIHEASLSTTSKYDLSRTMTRESATSTGIPESKSQISFRKMVMSSSLHTLQLASFTVQLDQKESTSSGELVLVLRQLKQYITDIYKWREITPEDELEARKKLCGFYELLVKYDCKQLGYGLLEIEWVRRSRIVEQQPELLADLWKFD